MGKVLYATILSTRSWNIHLSIAFGQLATMVSNSSAVDFSDRCRQGKKALDNFQSSIIAQLDIFLLLIIFKIHL